MTNQIRPVTDFAAHLRGRIVAHDGTLEQNFERLALELFQLQFALNGPYRRVAEARGLQPDRVRRWQDIPALPTTAFKELEFSCLPASERTCVFHSSGTTGHRPSRHFHNEHSLGLYKASALSWFGANVVEPGTEGMGVRAGRLGDAIPAAEGNSAALCRDAATPDRVDAATPKTFCPAILAPPPREAPHSSLVRMFQFARQALGAPGSAFLGTSADDGAWQLPFDAAVAALDSASRARSPVLMLGTAFSFVHLLEWLEKRKLFFALPPGSRAMETGGYKGRSRALPSAELHALITRRLGIPRGQIIREYGMSELSSQAYDRAGDGVFRFPPWARALVVSPETGEAVGEGETGLLRVFDLANAFSVLAIQTEDLAVQRGGGFELIGRAEAAEPRGCSLAAA